MQIEKETWHAKCLNFESKVQLFKKQKQIIMWANETHEWTILEKNGEGGSTCECQRDGSSCTKANIS